MKPLEFSTLGMRVARFTPTSQAVSKSLPRPLAGSVWGSVWTDLVRTRRTSRSRRHRLRRHEHSIGIRESIGRRPPLGPPERRDAGSARHGERTIPMRRLQPRRSVPRHRWPRPRRAPLVPRAPRRTCSPARPTRQREGHRLVARRPDNLHRLGRRHRAALGRWWCAGWKQSAVSDSRHVEGRGSSARWETRETR